MVKIKALLFDLDGTLVDAMPWHEEAFLAALRVAGVPLSQEEHAAKFAGLPSKEKLKILVAEGRLAPGKVNKVLQDKQGLTWSAIEQRCTQDRHRVALIEHLSVRYPLAVVTNCTKRTALEVLRRTGLLPFFETVVTSEDVKEPKPAAEPYLLACHQLGLEPRQTLVFEDHDRGTASAFAAGCYVHQLKAYQDLTIETVERAIKTAEAPTA